MLKKILYISCLLISRVFADTSVVPISNFDINKYTGKWYEIAHLAYYFEKDCVANIINNFTDIEGNLLFERICDNNSNETIISSSTIYTNNSTSAAFKVTSLPTWLHWSHLGLRDYWILYTDYNYAVIGTSNNQYLWILARHRIKNDERIQQLVDLAQKQGYDVSQLIYTR